MYVYYTAYGQYRDPSRDCGFSTFRSHTRWKHCISSKELIKSLRAQRWCASARHPKEPSLLLMLTSFSKEVTSRPL